MKWKKGHSYLCLVFRLVSGRVALARLNSGAFSVLLLLIRQFPLIPLQVVLITLNACVFFKNSATLGFSFALPLCRCWPKNFSTGSWQILFVKNTLTSGMLVKMYLVKSKNDLTIIIIGITSCIVSYTI